MSWLGRRTCSRTAHSTAAVASACRPCSCTSRRAMATTSLLLLPASHSSVSCSTVSPRSTRSLCGVWCMLCAALGRGGYLSSCTPGEGVCWAIVLRASSSCCCMACVIVSVFVVEGSMPASVHRCDANCSMARVGVAKLMQNVSWTCAAVPSSLMSSRIGTSCGGALSSRWGVMLCLVCCENENRAHNKLPSMYH